MPNSGSRANISYLQSELAKGNPTLNISASNDARTCAAVMISAPATGQGKTTVAAALARLYARTGRTVRVFKCGQDFLDPLWLSLASNAPVHQLDTWLMGERECRERLWEAAQEADLIIVEGVMGLFDGQPSSADMALAFSLPVVAVIDAWPMAQSFGAVALGLRSYRPATPWCGVLANRVAGDGHAKMLQHSVTEAAEWLGAMPNDSRISLPERSLGLTCAGEIDDPMARLDRAADALATHAGALLTALQNVAARVRFPAPPGSESSPRLLAGRTIAVARDAAFCFLYEANIAALTELGATIRYVSPLVDACLPPCDAVWLPGGYPELHVLALASNRSFRDSVLDHVARNRPVWAECGGMMCLFDRLETTDGTSHPMWGVFSGKVVMQKALAALGPQQISLSAGTLRGHAYHYSRCEGGPTPAAHAVRDPDHGRLDGEALFVKGNTRGSYFHAYFKSNLAATAQLFSSGAIL